MATIADLERAGQLVAYDPDFESDEFPSRSIFCAPAFVMWQEQILIGESSEEGRIVSPSEQLEQRFYEYAVGRPLIYERDRRLLSPSGFHVWELKTPDVRVFGWLPARRRFIAVCGEMKHRLLVNSNYRPFIDRVIAFRDQLDLDGP